MIVIRFTAQDHDERALTAWTDSMVHAWDQVSFTDTESEDDEELYHEMPRDVIRSSDLNRRLDHEALNRVNCYFERVFDLAGRSLGTLPNFGETAMNNCIMNSDSFNSLCQVYRKWS